jgi:hypothetical protein
MAIVAPIVSTFDNRGIRQAEGAFSRFGRSVGAGLRNVATAAAAIGTAVGFASVKAIQAAADLGEAVSATEQIFGDASAAVLDFADGAAEAFGQSKQAALDGALVFGTFGKAAGLAGDDLSDFTTGLLGLSSDLASFRNETPEAAIEAIGAALRGESEPLRRFGVLLDDATLKQEALELGIYSGNGALTQQQKILAAESAIYKQTADAQGDFARTSSGLSNQSRILSARLANVQTTLGTALLPVALKFAGFLGDTVVPAVEKLASTFAEEGLLGVLRLTWEWLKENGPKIGEWALGLAGSLIGWIAENAGPALKRLGKWLSAIGTWITDTAWPYLKEKVPIWAEALWNWIQTDGFDTLKKLGEWLASIGGWIIDVAWPYLRDNVPIWAEALWNWVQTTASDTLDKLEEWLGPVGTWITDTAWPKITEKTGEWATALFDWIGTDAADAISAAGDWLDTLGTWFAEDAGPLLGEKTGELVNTLFDWLTGDDADKETTSAAKTAIENLAIALRDEFIPGLTKYALGIQNAIVDALAGGFKAAGQRLAKDFVEGLTTGDYGIVGLLFDWAQKLNPLNWPERLLNWALGFGDKPDVPNIPIGGAPGGGGGGGGPVRLAKGGIVTKPTFAMIGEGGESEAVIPLSRIGKIGGTTINVTVNGAVDPVSTARQIRQILEQDKRRLGRLAVV